MLGQKKNIFNHVYEVKKFVPPTVGLHYWTVGAYIVVAQCALEYQNKIAKIDDDSSSYSS